MAKKKIIQTIVNPRRIPRGLSLTLVLAGGKREDLRVNRHGDDLNSIGGQLSGWGKGGARMIREAAARYFEAFDAMSPESRAKQLLAEADAYRERCHTQLRETIQCAASEMAAESEQALRSGFMPNHKGGFDTEAVERAVHREHAAYEAQTALVDHLELLFGEHLRHRWAVEAERAETLAEAKRLQAEKGDA